MLITITIFDHTVHVGTMGAVLFVAGLWLACQAVEWLRNRYEWDRSLWRPVRRWYAAGSRITGVDQRTYFVHDYDVDPEQTWVRVSVDDEADETDSRWAPIAEFMQPLKYARTRREATR